MTWVVIMALVAAGYMVYACVDARRLLRRVRPGVQSRYHEEG